MPVHKYDIALAVECTYVYLINLNIHAYVHLFRKSSQCFDAGNETTVLHIGTCECDNYGFYSFSLF